MNTEIIALRTEIDNLDEELLKILEERFQLIKEIGEIKKIEDIQIEDKQREEVMISSRVNTTSLDKEFVVKLFKIILEESKRIQSNEP